MKLKTLKLNAATLKTLTTGVAGAVVGGGCVASGDTIGNGA